MDNQTTQFLPFHAINEFMRPDYRLEVIRETLASLPSISEGYRNSIDQATRAVVQVPGFRNSAKAPIGKRVKPTADAFEKSPYLVAAILAAWAEAHPELRLNVYELLVDRGWVLLPPVTDRTQLPGFGITWPGGESFENLNRAFTDKYPGFGASGDDVSLMIVWLSVRLPYQFEENQTSIDDDPQDHSF
jgi:hypothetical protein